MQDRGFDVFINFKAKKSFRDLIRYHAQTNRISMSELIRQAIENAIDKGETK